MHIFLGNITTGADLTTYFRLNFKISTGDALMVWKGERKHPCSSFLAKEQLSYHPLSDLPDIFEEVALTLKDFPGWSWFMWKVQAAFPAVCSSTEHDGMSPFVQDSNGKRWENGPVVLHWQHESGQAGSAYGSGEIW